MEGVGRVESFACKFQRPVCLSRLWLDTNPTDCRTSLLRLPQDISCGMATTHPGSHTPCHIPTYKHTQSAPPAALVNNRYLHLPKFPCHSSLPLSPDTPSITKFYCFDFLNIYQILPSLPQFPWFRPPGSPAKATLSSWLPFSASHSPFFTQ